MSDDFGIDLTPEAFPSQSLVCSACGRRFDRQSAYSNHSGRCRFQKKRMANALGVAKEKYKNKKARLDPDPIHLSLDKPDQSASIIDAPRQVRISTSCSGGKSDYVDLYLICR